MLRLPAPPPVGDRVGAARPITADLLAAASGQPLAHAEPFLRLWLECVRSANGAGGVVIVGNVLMPASASGLPRDSVVNLSQIATIDKRELRSRVGRLPFELLDQLDAGLRLALAL